MQVRSECREVKSEKSEHWLYNKGMQSEGEVWVRG